MSPLSLLRNCLWLGWLFAPVAPAAPGEPSLPVLTTAQEVRALSREEAARSYPVHLSGLVTYFESEWRLCFVQDETAGIFVYLPSTSPAYQAGQTVEVDGTSAPGEFAPTVIDPALKPTGISSLPVPHKPGMTQLLTGREDSQWVEVEGVVRSVSSDQPYVNLELVANGARFLARVRVGPNSPDAPRLLDATVRLQGACGTIFNQRHQLTGIRLFVPSLQQVSVLEPAPVDPYAIPVHPGNSLMRFTLQTAADHRLKVNGVITLVEGERAFYVSDESGGLLVRTTESASVRRGDVVEVAGYPSAGALSPELQDALWRKVGTQSLPVPPMIKAEQAASGLHDAELVRMDGVLLEQTRRTEGRVLVLQAQDRIFDACLPAERSGAKAPALRLGSRIRVTGICSVQVDEYRQPRSFRMLLQSPNDVEVLRGVPLWTLENVMIALGIVSLVALSVSSWVVVLRRRINQQTRLIGERLRREAALEERYRDLIENANDIIYAHDLDGRVQSWNAAGERITGYTRQEALNLSLKDVVAPEHLARFHQMMECQLNGEEVTRHELDLIAKDGRRLTLEVSARLFRHEGKAAGVQGIGRDITERKHAEAELQRAKEAAEAANCAKSDFMATMSHEIRTPMNGIIGMNNLLLNTALNEEQRDYAQTVHESAEALLTIINDILDFSKIEAGKLHFDTVDFDLHEVVEGAVDLCASRALAKGLELGSLVHHLAPCRLRGDPGRLRQVLLNLVGNAVKFTEKGEVFVSAQPEREAENLVRVRFEVTDTGIGITPETQARLFQPFTQADSSTTRRYGGTGLGLAICKQLVERMNGQIGLRSNPGQGSTLWFTVELAKPATALAAAVRQADLGECRVLVVDDNATNRKILHHHIISWRLRNGTVDSGPAALEALRREAAAGRPYDLVLLDMHMPEMDGIMLAKAIGKEPLIANTKLILLTSLGRQFSTETLKAAGIAACLVRPVKQSALYDCMVEVLAKPSASATLHRARMIRKSASPEPPASTAPRSLRVLIAEDNVVNQKVAMRQLRKLGYQADAVANGMEVLAALEHISYDVILMDCQMPELDGYEATQRIRSRERAQPPAPGSQPVRVIAMTANAMDGDRAKCLAAGMDDYIPKPVREEQLRQALALAEHILQGPKPPAPAESHVNHDTLAEIRSLTEPGEADPLIELVDLFLGDTPDQLNGLRAALAAEDAAALHEVAHTLKGSCSNLGAEPMADLCRTLDQAAKAGFLASAGTLIDQIEAEFAEVKTVLEGERQTQLANLA